jgi:hypothetical protein
MLMRNLRHFVLAHVVAWCVNPAAGANAVENAAWSDQPPAVKSTS